MKTSGALRPRGVKLAVDLLAIVVGWLFLSMAAGLYADRLNRNAVGWTLMSLLLSPLGAFAFLFAVGARVSDRVDRVPCPFCSEANPAPVIGNRNPAAAQWSARPG